MATATFKCEFPRRQAMLSIRGFRPLDDGGWAAERVFVQDRFATGRDGMMAEKEGGHE